MVEDDPTLLERLRDPVYPDKVERAVVFTVDTWDINCPQHIHPRYSRRQIAAWVEQLQAKIADLEMQLATARRADRPSA